jgi:hypothetical protein
MTYALKCVIEPPIIGGTAVTAHGIHGRAGGGRQSATSSGAVAAWVARLVEMCKDGKRSLKERVPFTWLTGTVVIIACNFRHPPSKYQKPGSTLFQHFNFRIYDKLYLEIQYATIDWRGSAIGICICTEWNAASN